VRTARRPAAGAVTFLLTRDGARDARTRRLPFVALVVAPAAALPAAATTTAAEAAAATAAAAATTVAAATTAAAAEPTAATTAAAAEPTATAATAATEPAATTFLARLGFVDAQRPAVEVGSVHRLDGVLGVRVGAHLDEREAAGTGGRA